MRARCNVQKIFAIRTPGAGEVANRQRGSNPARACVNLMVRQQRAVIFALPTLSPFHPFAVSPIRRFAHSQTCPVRLFL